MSEVKPFGSSWDASHEQYSPFIPPLNAFGNFRR